MLKSLYIREMQIKTTVKYNVIPIRMAKIKKTKIRSIGAYMEKKKPLYTIIGNVN
jgi:hypothetical protein